MEAYSGILPRLLLRSLDALLYVRVAPVTSQNCYESFAAHFFISFASSVITLLPNSVSSDGYDQAKEGVTFEPFASRHSLSDAVMIAT